MQTNLNELENIVKNGEIKNQVHTSSHGCSANDVDDWRARQNRKPLKISRKKWLGAKP